MIILMKIPVISGMVVVFVTCLPAKGQETERKDSLPHEIPNLLSPELFIPAEHRLRGGHHRSRSFCSPDSLSEPPPFEIPL